ncbi:MAG: hypothetical protein RIQ59_1733 [Bacteroidota bacterium]|jgi:hypothetical protein
MKMKLKNLILTVASIFVVGCSSNDSKPIVVPVAPTNLVGNLTNSQIVLTWTDNSTNETGFTIERKIGTGTYTQIGTVATNIATYSDVAVSAGNTYTYRVFSTNSAGNSTTYSNEVTITIPLPVTVPVSTTTATSSITSTGAISGGTISSDGGGTVTARGVVWSTSTNPTISLTTKTTDGTGTGSFASTITGLTANTQYYVRSYATNSAGTSYGNEITFTTLPTIGQSYQGGIIAYILQPGDSGYVAGEFHGIISATTDQVINITWGNGSWISTGATATALRTGNANTNTIVSVLSTGNYAARLCYDLVLNGYSDWYLPSRDEMSKMILNKNAIGGFSSANYWSSSEYDIRNAYYSNFTSGSANLVGDKLTVANVRAVRSF